VPIFLRMQGRASGIVGWASCLVCMLVMSCSESEAPAPAPVPVPVKLRLTAALSELVAGEHTSISPTLYDAEGKVLPPKEPYEWKSSNSAIVAVDQFGGATAGTSLGDAFIVLSIQGLTDSVAVHVRGPFYIWPDTLTLYAGMTRQLDAFLFSIAQGRSTATGVAWSSLDTSHATVDESGNVTAIRPGQVRIVGERKGASDTTDLFIIPNPEVSFKAISTYRHTCAITTEGTPYCWGYIEPETIDSAAPADRCEIVDRAIKGPTPFYRARKACSAIPRLIKGDVKLKTIHVYRYACGVAVNGKSYCWGRANYGSWVPDYLTPTVIFAGRDLSDVYFGEGERALCGVTLTHDVFCDNWGNLERSASQIGAGLQWTALSLRSFSACALTIAGRVYCWGDNFGGSLAVGSTNDVVAAPLPVLSETSTPLPVFTSVGGTAVGCGLQADGKVFCWGGSATGFNELRIAPAVPTTLRLKAFAVDRGVSDPVCGLATDGTVYCVVQRKTSVRDSVYALEPLNVSVPVPLVTLSRGKFSGCGIGVDGIAYCWGGGALLGNGTFVTDPASAVRVAGQR
jgi:hypothetical protein